MPDIDLAAMKARADAATPGPWETVPTVGNAVVSADGDGYWTDVADRIEVEEDAIFIAEARADVPALLAEVERLQHVIRDLAEDGGNKAAEYWLRAHQAEQERDQAEQEVDRLRGIAREAEDARDRANQRLGNLSISLNESLAPEIKRQKAEAWNQGHVAGHESHTRRYPWCACDNPYREQS